MSKRRSKAKRPYWQTEPCPSWCWGHHDDGEHPTDERKHRTRWEGRQVLSLAEPVATWHQTRGRYVFDPVELMVHVQQGYRETEPRVIVEPEHTESGSRYDFTLAEAERIGRALLKAVEVARKN